MNIKILNILLFVILATSAIFSNDRKNVEGFKRIIQPTPKSLISLNKIIQFDLANVKVIATKVEEQKAANYLSHLLIESFSIKLKRVSYLPVKKRDYWVIKLELVPSVEEYVNDQYYSINCNRQTRTIEIQSSGQLGLLYGVVSFNGLIEKKNDLIYVYLYNIMDWPDYSRRMVHSYPEVSKVGELLDFALRYKIETVAIASRKYSWFKVDDEYQRILNEIKEWKEKYGGPHVMQMHNVYEEKIINTADQNDINALKNVIKTSIECGVDKLMILADDTPPFKYGKGYILTYDEEKEKYKHLAESHSLLMYDIKNWLTNNSLTSELYYVPGFYTYEDMHLLPMEYC